MAQVLIREVKTIPPSSMEEPETRLLYLSSGFDIPVVINPGWPRSRKMLFWKKWT